MEFGNALPYDINIRGSHNKGFILKAGCCTLVFTDKKTMLNAIADYINEPEKMEKEYNKLNRDERPQPVSSTRGDMIREEGDCDCAQEESQPWRGVPS